MRIQRFRDDLIACPGGIISLCGLASSVMRSGFPQSLNVAAIYLLSGRRSLVQTALALAILRAFPLLEVLGAFQPKRRWDDRAHTHPDPSF